MEEAFLDLLEASGPVTALVPAARINWGEHPQGFPWPGVILRRISDRNDHSLDGPETVREARIQVDCVAPVYGDAKRLGRAVRAALDGHHDATFQGVLLAGARDDRETGATEAERLFRVSLDFLVTYNANA